MVLEHAPERRAELAITIEDQEPLLSQEAIDAVGQVARNLLHEVIVGIRSAGDDLDGSRGKVDDEERVVGHEAVRRPDLGREEVASGDRCCVRSQELTP